MKTKITSITLLLYIIASFGSLSAQTTGLNVLLKDECGLTYSKPAKVVLRAGPNRTAIDSVSSAPYTFKNLQDNTVHYLTVEVQGNPTPEIGLRDVVTIQQYILGTRYSNTAVPYVSDVNSDGKVTAADMVSLSQWIFDNSAFLNPKWKFAPEIQSFAQPVNLLELVVTPKAGTTSDLNVKVLKNGESAVATGEYCNNKCPDDPTLAALIYTDSLVLESDKEYLIPFYVKANKGYFGIASVLDFRDGEILSISGQSRINNNKDQVNLLFTSLNSDNMPPLVAELVTNIRFKPTKNGIISDFFSLAPTPFLQEVITYNGTCFIKGSGISLNMFANPIEDCVITWPPDVTLPNCKDLSISGSPTVSVKCAQQIKFYYEDFGSECNQVQRSWKALDWSNGKTIDHVQTIKYDEKYPTICYPDYLVNLSNGNVDIFASQLGFSVNSSSKFSFSSTDENDTIRTILPSFRATEDFVLYNLDDKTSCMARVLINNCIAQPSIVNITDEISVPDNNGYLVFGASFDFGSENTCTPIRDFQLSQDDIHYSRSIAYQSSMAGQNVSLFLRYRLGNEWVKYGTVTAILKASTTENVIFHTQNVKLEAFQTYNIGITPYQFDNILSFQIGMLFKNIAQDIEVVPGSFPITGNSYYYNPIEKALNIVWYKDNLIPLSLPSSSPMFFIKIKPNRDGLLSEFIVQSKVLPGTGIKKNSIEEVVDFDLIIGDNPLSTDVADIKQKVSNSYFYPNPVMAGNQLYIQLTDIEQLVSIEIFDSKGMKVDKFSNHSIVSIQQNVYGITLDESLKSGLYFMRLNASNRFYTWKLIVL